jgi:hypothetical protein
MDKKKATLIIEKLSAMEAFSKDVRIFIQELIDNPETTEVKVQEVAAQVEPAKVEVKTEVVEEDIPVGDPTQAQQPDPEVTSETVTVDQIIADYELLDMEVSEMKEFLDSYEIKYNKYKKVKQYFAEVIAENIISGVIPTEEEEEATDEQEADAGDNGAEDTGVESSVGETEGGDTGVEEVEAEEIAEEEEEETEEALTDIPEARAKAEATLEATIRDDFKNKKLKPTAMKAFLKKYYDGDPDCSDCKGCSSEEHLDCYLDIQKALVDDEGEVNEMSNPYIRNDENYCCGKALVQHPDDANVFVCEVCGETYES